MIPSLLQSPLFLPTFQLQFNDLGAGLVRTNDDFGAAATFTRATTAWTKLSTGKWASVASGAARYFYSGLTDAAGSGLGFLAEGARTNSALQSRTLSAYTATSVTVAVDQAGIDGSAGVCASLTATGANGTVLQSITIASTGYVFQPFVRRITGTGEIDITLDNGSTWTNITSLISSGVYTQVAATQTQLNPTIGFRIVTSGDKIAVDMADMQNGTFPSTPVPSSVAAVTRNADVMTYPIGSILNYGAAHTIVVRGQYFNVTGNSANWNVLAGSDVNYDGLLRASTGAANGSSDYFSDSGGSVGATLAGTDAARQNTTLTYIGRRNVNSTLDIFVNKVKGTTSAAAGAAGSPTLIEVACHASLLQLNGTINSFRIYPQALPDGVCQQF